MRAVDGREFAAKFEKVRYPEEWYCWMNTWEEDKASCAAPQYGWEVPVKVVPSVLKTRPGSAASMKTVSSGSKKKGDSIYDDDSSMSGFDGEGGSITGKRGRGDSGATQSKRSKSGTTGKGKASRGQKELPSSPSSTASTPPAIGSRSRSRGDKSGANSPTHGGGSKYARNAGSSGDGSGRRSGGNKTSAGTTRRRGAASPAYDDYYYHPKSYRSASGSRRGSISQDGSKDSPGDD